MQCSRSWIGAQVGLRAGVVVFHHLLTKSGLKLVFLSRVRSSNKQQQPLLWTHGKSYFHWGCKALQELVQLIGEAQSKGSTGVVCDYKTY
jgi:hypothetical protein